MTSLSEVYRWMTVEDVIVSFARWTGPDVSKREAQLLHVVQVPEQNLVINRSTEMSRPEKVNRVEVCNVNSASVRHRRIGSIFLNVHTEEANVNAVDLLESEQGPSPIRKSLAHFSGVNKPDDDQI